MLKNSDTVFQNYKKSRIIQFFKKSSKWTIFGILMNFCPLKM